MKQKEKQRFFGKILTVLLMAAFLLNYNYLGVYAQEEEELPPRDDSDLAAEEAELEELAVPDEVVEDATVTPEDLGIKDQNVLPDSPLYPIKEAWREIKHAVTFSDVGDAKLDLQYASEKLIEAQKLAEAEDVSEAEKTPQVEEALANYNKEYADFDKELEEIAAGGQDAEGVEELQELAVEANIEQTSLLDNLEQSLPEDAFAGIDQARERSAEEAAKAVSELGADQEKIRELIARAATKEKGSQLKGLKALEVLKRVEEKVPDQAKDAIKGAQENILRHLEGKLAEIPEEARLKKLAGYMRHMPGDPIRRLKMLDEMKFKAELPEEVIEHIEVMKAKAVEMFDERMKRFQNPETRERMFEHLKRGELADVRVFEDLQAHSLDEEVRQSIEQHHQEGLQKFRQAFAGDAQARDVANRAEALMAQIRDNPDPKTFRLLEELKNELTPEQRAFVARMEDAGKEEMEARFEQEREKFFKRMNSINPKDFAFMDDFRQDFAFEIGGEFGAGFQEVIESSSRGIKERIRAFERPEDVEQFKAVFDGQIPPEARAAIRGQIPDFERLIEERKEEALKQFEERREFLRKAKEEFGGEFESEFKFEGKLQFDSSEVQKRIREKFKFEFADDFGFTPSPDFEPGHEFPGFGEFPGGGATGGEFPGRGPAEEPTGPVNPNVIEEGARERRIDPELLKPAEDAPRSSVTCAPGLVWVPDPKQPAGGICARETSKCPVGYIADVLGKCIKAPTREPAVEEQPEAPRDLLQPPSQEQIDRFKQEFQERFQPPDFGPTSFDPVGAVGKVLGIFLES